MYLHIKTRHIIYVIKIVVMVASLQRCCGRKRENVPDVYVNQFLLLVVIRRTIVT
jgi:hypothetical protein